MITHASAPGKLFLLGEYAVLAGGPALLAAVDRRATVSVRPSEEAGVCVREGTRSCGRIGQTPLLDAVIESMAARQLVDPAALEACRLVLDTSDFFVQDEKLGMGSSAALTVAIVRALYPQGDVDEDMLSLVRACHGAFQGGLGSGADVATALLGGSIRFSSGHSPASVELPADLRLLYIWTGTGAATTPYVARLNAWRAEEPARADDFLSWMAELSGAAIDALEKGRTDVFIDEVARYNQGLIELSDVAALESYAPSHRALREIVETGGCTYKPSGAGGGDFGIAFSTDPKAIELLKASLEEQDYLVLSPAGPVPGSSVSAEE